MDFRHPVRTVVPSLEGEVYRILAGTTAPLTGSRIAQLAEGRSSAGVRFALGRMVVHGTVLSSSAGSATLYTANRDHLLWPAIESLIRATEAALEDLVSRIVVLAEQHSEPLREEKPTIAIYGSVARGDSTLTSDIDLVAVFPAPGMTALDEALVDELTDVVPRWTGNICNVYAMTSERLSELGAEQDPILGPWASESRTIFGRSLAGLIDARRTRP